MTGIYMIKNKINGNLYIGQAQNLAVRIGAHKTELNGNYHHNKYLQNAWNKYGKDNFEFSVIEHCSIESLNEREIYWIAYYKDKVILYNHTAGGEGLKNVSEEVRKKLSVAHTGKTVSEETKQKMSLAHKGKKHKPLTAEQRKALSAARKGRKNSEYQKLVAKKQMQERWKTTEWIEKVRSGIRANIDHYGHSQTAATREKIGNFNRGKIWIHNEKGCIKIYPEDFETYKKLGYLKGMK